ncbi:hypothetical protein [Embleya sp. NBC_00896]|uniref:hypothetical protein n=1 Tax=Embleya sp. NBC_00896 TaxID=2975961 RepID=UPI0038696B70|nr:hypothetical protein OG928_23675 [Embleya sp. NBC_00896]
MGVRIRRIAPACAAVVLLATGCMVGPTIDDEKGKAAHAGATGNPPDLPGKNTPGGATPGVVPSGGAVPSGAVPQKTGTHAYSNGLTVTSLPLTVKRATTMPDDKKDRVDVAVPIRWLNRTKGSITAELLIVELYAGPDSIACTNALVGEARTGPDEAARGVETIITYNFAVPRALLGKLVIQIRPLFSRLDRDNVTFETSVTPPEGSPTRPAEGPSTQPTTRVVPRSTPTVGASDTSPNPR